MLIRGLFICSAIWAGQGLAFAAPPPGDPAVGPAEFTPSYEIALRKNPELMAQRFLRAFDRLAQSGPVTVRTVRDNAQAPLPRGNRDAVGGILAVDLNGDGLITRIEFQTRPAAENGEAAIDPQRGVFEFDETQEDLMRFEDAVKFGQDLFEGPIEPFLMRFDLNADGQLVRDELVTGLEAFVRASESGSADLF